MAISFIGAATASSSTNGITSFTVNKHASTAVGDLMLVSLCFSYQGTQAPNLTLTGWTQVEAQYDSGTHEWISCLVVYKRYMLAGDTSWTATISGDTAESYSTATVSYRGVDATTTFVSESGRIETTDNTTTVATPTINNTDSNAWWVAVFSEFETPDTTKTWTANAGTERADVQSGDVDWNATTAIYDSNGTVATGNVTVTGTISSTNVHEKDAWLGLLKSSSAGTANAGQAAGSAVANQAVPAITITAGQAAATATANVAATAHVANAGQAAATATAYDAGIMQPIAAFASAVAYQPRATITEVADPVTAVAVAFDATVLRPGGLAAGAATAYNAVSFTTTTTPATATASAVAWQIRFDSFAVPGRRVIKPLDNRTYYIEAENRTIIPTGGRSG